MSKDETKTTKVFDELLHQFTLALDDYRNQLANTSEGVYNILDDREPSKECGEEKVEDEPITVTDKLRKKINEMNALISWHRGINQTLRQTV